MDATKETSERRKKPKNEAQIALSEVSEDAQAPETQEEATASPEESAPASESEASESAEIASAVPDRKRIEEQLEALKRKESELRRALAVADHPELAEAIRVLEGRAYAVTRVELKMAQGLSKTEERRRETLEKKLSSLREKRAELDAQIVEVEGQLAPLGEERTRAFDAERREALEQLIAVLSRHHDELHAAGLDAASLVPDIARWMPEVVALAERLATKA